MMVKLEELSSDLVQLRVYCSQFTVSMNQMTETSMNAALAFKDVFATRLIKKDFCQENDATIKEDIKGNWDGSLSLEPVENLLEVYSELNPIIINTLDISFNRVQFNLQQVEGIFNKIKKFLRARNYALRDYEYLTEALDKLESKNTDVSSTKQDSLVKLRRRSQIQKERYEDLNTIMKQELPLFFDLLDKFSKWVFEEIYYTQISIYDLACTYLKDTEIVLDEDYGKVEEETLARQAKMVKFLNSLRSCNTHETRLRKSPKLLEVTLDTKPEEKIETCTALYDFEHIQETDLDLKAGDEIRIIAKSTEGNTEWWQGELNGKFGAFPSNYVRLNS